VDARTADSAPETPIATPAGPILVPARGRLALSPINRRRWESFKRNRRGYISLWIFAFLFTLSLLA
jgi:microcin C transport system permease protein